MKEVGPLLLIWMRKAQELAAENCPDPYHNGQSIKEALWRIFIGDHSMGGRPVPLEHGKKYERLQKLYNQLEGYFEAMQDFSLEAMRELPDNLMNKLPIRTMSGFERFEDDISEAFHFQRDCIASYGRKVAVTQKGYLCLVPPKTEVGDMVCLIQSAGTPFILRKSKTRDENEFVGKQQLYALVGEAYVHGIMDGDMDNEELSWAAFEIQ